MAERHFIHSIVKHYFSGADAVERSYTRAMGESFVLSALSGASIYSGISHMSPLEVAVGFSSFLSSFVFLEISAKGLIKRYEA